MTPLNHLAAKLANRVLGDYPLALQQLKTFSAARIFIHAAGVDVALRITSQGDLEPCGEGSNTLARTPSDLTVSIPLAALPAGISSGRDALNLATFTGNTDLAALLHELAKHLSWDAEHDLSQIIGEIAAHRVANAACSAHANTSESIKRLGENGAEYLVHEAKILVSQAEARHFQAQLETLRDDIARLEKRTGKIANLLA